MKNRPKKKLSALTAAGIGVVLAIAGASQAQAVSQSFGWNGCSWGMHSYVELSSTGGQTLRITGTNGVINEKGWGWSGTLTYRSLDSPTRDSASAVASNSEPNWSSWGFAAVGCRY